MNKMKIRLPLALTLITIMLLTSACDVIMASQDDTAGDILKASGMVEAVEISAMAELPGKITDVLVEEGDEVVMGDVLFILDDHRLEDIFECLTCYIKGV